MPLFTFPSVSSPARWLPIGRAGSWGAACLMAALSWPVAAARTSPDWPPGWQAPATAPSDFSPVAFDAPAAADCRRLPPTREVPGGGGWQGDERERGAAPMRSRRSEAVADKAAAAGMAESAAAPVRALPAPSPSMSPAPSSSTRRPPPRPAQAGPVTAGMVDDNADFTEYLAYRGRQAGLVVRDRDVAERYRLEVTDAAGRPVADAEVAVQRAGTAEPVAWARTDAAGRVWLHPRAFLAPAFAAEPSLGIAVRKQGTLGRAVLVRGQAHAVQVRLDAAAVTQRPRLDLVFIVDATGSMGDEIAKLTSSMHTMAQQISQLPGRPDICYGLVAYRDRGDAFLTRTHDFTDRLSAFQQVLARLQAGGGGDTPEALDEALHEAVHGLSWRQDAVRLAVLVADAPPHVTPRGTAQAVRYDRDMQAALAKGIKLFAIGASGLDPVGEYVFRQMAQYTGGRFVFLTYRDAAEPSSGPGEQTAHDVRGYSVQTLDRIVVSLVADELAALTRP